MLDANGTDGRAEFQLPAADPTNSGDTTYSVFARAVGKPGGSSSMKTCATDQATGELWCSVESMTLQRKMGKWTATNVQDFFLAYDNTGLSLAQLRFYPCSTNVETGSTACFK